MPYRSPARMLAPLALVAFAIAVGVVITSSDGEGGDGSTATTASPTTTTSRPSASRFYTVRSGDVVSAIAERTGVSVDRIFELNPNLDPNTLRAGQRLRIRR